MHNFVRMSWLKAMTLSGNFEFFYHYQEILILSDNFSVMKQVFSFVEIMPWQVISADTRSLPALFQLLLQIYWSGEPRCTASSYQHHWQLSSRDAAYVSLHSLSYPGETAVKHRAPWRSDLTCGSAACSWSLLSQPQWAAAWGSDGSSMKGA